MVGRNIAGSLDRRPYARTLPHGPSGLARSTGSQPAVLRCPGRRRCALLREGRDDGLARLGKAANGARLLLRATRHTPLCTLPDRGNCRGWSPLDTRPGSARRYDCPHGQSGTRRRLPERRGRASRRGHGRLYRDGHTLDEVGRAFGVSRQRVGEIFDRVGLARRSPAQRAAEGERAARAQADEVLARCRSVGEPGQVARELGLPRVTVQRLVGERLEKPALYRPKRRPTKRFDDEEILDCLRRAADELPAPVALKGYARLARYRRFPDGRRWPSQKTIELRFGGWRSALKAAGPPTRRRHVGARCWTPRACRSALQKAADRLGHAPSSVEYDRASWGKWRRVPEPDDCAQEPRTLARRPPERRSLM